MRITSLLYLLLPLVGFSIAESALGKRHDDKPSDWMMLDFQRRCGSDGKSCEFSFRICEGLYRDPTYCTFTVEAESEDDPALQRSFDGYTCRETSEYTISSGWQPSGFIVLVISNKSEGLFSFFGFEDTILERDEPAPTQTARALSAKPPESSFNPRWGRRQEDEGLAYADEWKVTDVYRYLIESEEHPGLAISFGIEHPDHETEFCLLIATGKPGDDPKTISFANMDCRGGRWGVSWGYEPDSEFDVAIMTLMNEKRDRRAFFGFRYVNDKVDLGDNGPEKTHDFMF